MIAINSDLNYEFEVFVFNWKMSIMI